MKNYMIFYFISCILTFSLAKPQEECEPRSNREIDEAFKMDDEYYEKLEKLYDDYEMDIKSDEPMLDELHDEPSDESTNESADEPLADSWASTSSKTSRISSAITEATKAEQRRAQRQRIKEKRKKEREARKQKHLEDLSIRKELLAARRKARKEKYEQLKKERLEKKRELQEMRKEKRNKKLTLRESVGRHYTKPPKTKLKKEEKEKMKRHCKRRANGCRAPSTKGQAKRESLKRSMTKAQMKREQRRLARKEKRLSDDELQTIQAQVEEKNERRLNSTMRVKRALYQQQNISDDDEIEPDDDGTWQGDLILSEDQAQILLEKLETDEETEEDMVPVLPGDFEADVDLFTTGDVNETDPTHLRRAKRFALYLEDNLGARWDKMPIPILIEDTFEANEVAIIKSALDDIVAKSCVRFDFLADFPEDDNHAYIFFVKERHATFCGLSSIGRQGEETMVWLNFDGDCASQINGTIIHETMHALGVDHQHVRYDRTKYVDFKYDNINPQSLDIFAQGDTTVYTSYGIPYDIYSIMHYSSQSGTMTEGTNSMEAILEPRQFFTEVMGQRRGLSSRDGELLRRMYCIPDCDDYVVYCGWWATVGYCESKTASMLEYCPKSCNFCPGKTNSDAQRKVKAAQEKARFLAKKK